MLNEFVSAEGTSAAFAGVTKSPLEAAFEIASEERVSPGGLLIQEDAAFSLTSEDAPWVIQTHYLAEHRAVADFSENHDTTDQLLEWLSPTNADRVWSQVQTVLDAFRRSPESNDMLALTFGETASTSQMQAIIGSLTEGQHWPKVRVMPRAQLIAWGAYAAQSETIYLAEELGEQPEILAQVLVEELGHFIDDQVNGIDSPGDEGALFAGFVMNRDMSDEEILSLKGEDDTATLTLDGKSVLIEMADDTPGTFTVGAEGQIIVEFLADGGGYKGQVAVFNLAGMEGLAPGSPAFIKEAARRALSDSSLGRIIIDDITEKATLSGELGERDRNSGETTRRKAFQFDPGSHLAIMLVPHGAIDVTVDNPTATGRRRPLFSLAEANPEGRIHMGRISPGIFAMEDISFDRKSDGDFNDIIFQLSGATEQLEAVTNLIENNQGWVGTPLGQQIFQTLANTSPVGFVSAEPVFSQDTPFSELPPLADENTPDIVVTPVTETPATETPVTENPSIEPPVDPGTPVVSGGEPISTNPEAQSSISGSVAKFSSGSTEASIAASGAASLSLGTQTIYAGTNQVSGNNQNPIIASFDSSNPANNWVNTNYETTGADGRGLGLAWSGENLYGVFSVDGTQGSPSEDFRRASNDAEQQWLRSYGAGGGAKIAVIGRINPANGELLDAAYLSAVLMSGNSNSLSITDIRFKDNGNLVIEARSFFSPRRPDGSAMTQIGTESSPFAYTVEMTSDLKRVVSTSAEGWV